MAPISEHCQIARNAFRCKTMRWWLKQSGVHVFHTGSREMGPPVLALCLVVSCMSTLPCSAGRSLSLWPLPLEAWWLVHLQTSCPSSRQEMGLGAKVEEWRSSPFHWGKVTFPKVLTSHGTNCVCDYTNCKGVWESWSLDSTYERGGQRKKVVNRGKIGQPQYPNDCIMFLMS